MKWKVLAGLRFFLAAIVICYHLKDFVPEYSNDWLCSFGRLNGLAAVLGFLIVSGYSIANSIHKEPRGFYQRRVFRIYPLYFCAILFSLIPFVFLGNKFTILGQDYYQPDVVTVLGNFALLQTFLVDSLPSNIVLWTLSIEVFCYLLTPGLAKLNNRFLALLIGLSSTFYVSFPFLQKFLTTGSDFPFYSHWKFGIPFCLFLWAWLLGFLYARIEEHSEFKLFVIGFGCVLIGLNSHHIGKVGIFTYAISALVLVSVTSWKLPSTILKVFDYLGNLSYPLYLFHIPTFILLYAVGGITNSFSLLLVAVFVSMLFYHLIDIPLRGKKAKPSSTLISQSEIVSHPR